MARSSDEVVHRIPLRLEPRRMGTGNSRSTVGLEDGRPRRQARTDPLWPSTHTGEDVRFDEPGQDSQLRVHISAIECDVDAIDLPHRHVLVADVMVNASRIRGEKSRTQELLELGRGGGTVGPGCAKKRNILRPCSRLVEQGQQRGQHRLIRHRPGVVREDDGDGPAGNDQVDQGWASAGIEQRMSNRFRLVLDRRAVAVFHDRRIVGDLELDMVAAVLQGDPHRSYSWRMGRFSNQRGWGMVTPTPSSGRASCECATRLR